MRRIHHLTIACLVLTACGGIPHQIKVSGSLDNQSDYPATLTLHLSESSVEDGCKPDSDSQQKAIVVAPHSQQDGELTWTCDDDYISKSVEFRLTRPHADGEPDAKDVIFRLGAYLKAPLVAGQKVLWLGGDGAVRASVISAEPVFTGGSASLPSTADLLKNPVRTDGQLLQFIYTADATVTALGADSSQFSDAFDPDAPANSRFIARDGGYFFPVFGQAITGTIDGRVGDGAHVVCTNGGCQ